MELKKTITTIFMIPTLGIDKDRLRENGCLNGYIKDIRKDFSYENCIYILFKPNDLEKFRDFLDDEYERTKSIVEDYDYEDGYIVVVYELNNKFKKDFNLIRKGIYSKTSQEFQNLFPKNVKIRKGDFIRDEISLQYRIFNKTEDLVKFWEDKLGVEFDEDQEVWHAFIPEEEVLNLDKIKKHVQ